MGHEMFRTFYYFLHSFDSTNPIFAQCQETCSYWVFDVLEDDFLDIDL